MKQYDAVLFETIPIPVPVSNLLWATAAITAHSDTPRLSLHCTGASCTNVTQAQTQAQVSIWLSTTIAYIVVDNQVEPIA